MTMGADVSWTIDLVQNHPGWAAAIFFGFVIGVIAVILIYRHLDSW